MSKVKEDIYDDRIATLMTKIIEICKENDIAMLCSFELGAGSDESLFCTTHLKGSEILAKALKEIYGLSI